MAYATQVGIHVVRKFNRPMAYLQALRMVLRGYREVTIRDDFNRIEAKVIRTDAGGIRIWTPEFKDKWSISKFVGGLMPMAAATTEGAPA